MLADPIKLLVAEFYIENNLRHWNKKKTKNNVLVSNLNYNESFKSQTVLKLIMRQVIYGEKTIQPLNYKQIVF